MNRYEVFRVIVGRGLVDFLGVIRAKDKWEAEDIAASTYDCDPEKEELQVALLAPGE